MSELNENQIPKLIVVSDFDGTIALDDTGNIIIEKCMDTKDMLAIENEYWDGKIPFKRIMEAEWGAVNMQWSEAVELLKDSRIDSHFPDLLEWCERNEIPIGVVSAGLDKLIDLIFRRSLTNDQLQKLEVFSNKLSIVNGRWIVEYADDSDMGHDKAATIEKVIRRYTDGNSNKRPKVVFIGDGISDIACVKKADYLFAKRGLDLHNWCVDNGISVTPIDDFSQVFEKVKEIYVSL